MTLRINVLEHSEKQRDIAQRVHDQEEDQSSTDDFHKRLA
jgi:hypothetical protein